MARYISQYWGISFVMLNCSYSVIKTEFVCGGRRFMYRSNDYTIFPMSFLITTVDCLLQAKLSGQLSPDLTEIRS